MSHDFTVSMKIKLDCFYCRNPDNQNILKFLPDFFFLSTPPTCLQNSFRCIFNRIDFDKQNIYWIGGEPEVFSSINPLFQSLNLRQKTKRTKRIF